MKKSMLSVGILLAILGLFIFVEHKERSTAIDGTYSIYSYNGNSDVEFNEWSGFTNWDKNELYISGSKVIYEGEFYGIKGSYEGKYNWFTGTIIWEDTNWIGAKLTGKNKVIISSMVDESSGDESVKKVTVILTEEKTEGANSAVFVKK
jgi:hypothetical protein